MSKTKNTNGDKMKKYCELNEEKICDNCGECEICDLDKNKICDNCCMCIGLEEESDYKVVEVEEVEDGVDYDFTEDEERIYIDWVSKKVDKQ